MILEELQKDGRRKKVLRRLFIKCQACGDTLTCPDDVEQWGWLKIEPATSFQAAHQSHGKVSSMFELIEID